MNPPLKDTKTVVVLHPEHEDEHTTSYVGMVIFLGSWAVMFAALFFSYGIHRSGVSEWPPPGIQPLPLFLPSINTALILLSSVFLHCAVRSARRANTARFSQWMTGTLVFGLGFLASQIHVWTGLWESGLTLRSAGFGSYFYLLTVFHAVHVVVGLALLLWVTLHQIRQTNTVKQPARIRLASMFWHFVGVVWVLTFVIVYAL